MVFGIFLISGCVFSTRKTKQSRLTQHCQPLPAAPRASFFGLLIAHCVSVCLKIPTAYPVCLSRLHMSSLTSSLRSTRSTRSTPLRSSPFALDASALATNASNATALDTTGFT